MATLQSQFDEMVDPRVRIAGRNYLSEGRVTKIDRIDEVTIEAAVEGNERYLVFLNLDQGSCLYGCSCPYYVRHMDCCKHVWATVLAADAAGLADDWARQDLDFAPMDDDWIGEFDEEETEDQSEAHEPDDLPVAGPINERRIRTASTPTQSKPDWKRPLSALRSAMLTASTRNPTTWPPGRELAYVVDVKRTLTGAGLALEVGYREHKKDGTWSKLKFEPISSDVASRLNDRADREIVSMLIGATNDSSAYFSGYYASATRYRLNRAQVEPILRRASQTGRCLLRIENAHEEPALLPLAWDDGPPWRFMVHVAKDPGSGRLIVSGRLSRTGADGIEHQMPLTEPLLLTEGGLLFTHELIAPLDDSDAFPWIVTLREHPELSVPEAQADELLNELLTVSRIPPLQLPQELQHERVERPPQPRLRISRPKRNNGYGDRLHGELSFAYDGHIVGMFEQSGGIFQPERRRLIVRDPAAEQNALARLRELGFRQISSWEGDEQQLDLAPNSLPAVVRKLTAENWHVEAEGKLYRQPGAMKIEVSSGVDWFELHGTADFDGHSVKLPTLLAALRKGERTVTLGDGTLGVLPEEWLKKYGALAGMGTAQEDFIQFRRAQVGLLDALLATQPEATCDAVFEHARGQLLTFEGVRAADAPPGFIGTLRPYQNEGLGWMQFLRDFGFGGCLADDMGLGKTVQVLALLEARRARRQEHPSDAPGRPGPTLVVAPRSLIFNWREEATRFAPKLRVIDHTGINRAKSIDAFADHDLVLTTYGTLRNDVAMLKDLRFDYLVLDEAQAIKNAASESAKAVRLLNGDHRLVLSGTPVQNHLGELWSIFEFLNPGMLGTARAFQAGGAGARIVEDSTRQVLARALRPFILRRTKAQVARDLPERLEQTIHCELEGKQRKLYDELREHYRHSLLARIERDGIRRSKIQILEALLRLRQAACHPGLIDKSKIGMGSAKLDALMPQLAEVTEEGHKALVFSQFTSFLSIVRDRLDAAKMPYEYLDGKTRNRQEVVERFQNNADCRLFLISLKAGGLGLNLTAAEYVFLLDPWWNPAVEAQAIDRAHRIGQTRQVFAYRLIAKDTVEEKVLKLQESKRELADAIINADNSVISKLGREELELLLS